MAADLVVRGARVSSTDGSTAPAEGVAITGERITAAGDNDDLAELIGPRTEVIEGAGRTLLPGFIDAHNHVRLGSNPSALSLTGATSLDEIHARIRLRVADDPGGDWIEGEGWNYSAVPGGRPTAAMLEGIAGGRPAFLFSYDVHTVWLNREAMTRLGIAASADRHLPWGRVELDATGEPTGFVTDFAVLGISEEGQRVLEAAGLPGYARQTQYERLVESLDMAIGYGITTVVEPQNGLDDLELFARARDEGTLRSRLIAALLCLPGTDAARLDDLEEARRTFDDDRFRVAPIKLYVDDVIEPHTAAMLEPYADDPSTRGDTFWDPEEFSSFLVELERRGFQAFTHATGDRGIRTMLDAVQRCREVHGPRDARHQIVHVECVHPGDLPRFAELGVVACMQPRHCAPDIVADWRSAVGPQRERFAWPFRSLRDAGAVLAFSSDWNVAEMDPMTWLYTAITRADLEGNDAWNTGETVDLATAIRAATWGSAYANLVEGDRGTIAPGKRGDLVLLSHDIGAIGEPRELLGVTADVTIVGGRVVFERGA